ncbi:MAG TPA: nucleotidyltransferase domain-containing protein [Rhodanobacteraceae bacterium]
MSLHQLTQALARHTDLRLAIVFGSVAKGTARPDSDIDVAVKADAPLTPAQKMRLIEDIAMATGRPVDLIDLAVAGEPLLGEIIRHGKQLLGGPEAMAELALKHVYLNEDFVPLIKRALDTRNNAWLN